MIRVPRAGTSPPASFRVPVTGEPLALSEWFAVAMIRYCTLIPSLWPDVIRVPRAGTSPPASFRVPVTGEPLALSEWFAVAMIR